MSKYQTNYQAQKTRKLAQTLIRSRRADLISPEFLGLNRWQTASTSRPGVIYKQNVFFAGYCKFNFVMNEPVPVYAHGFQLDIECGCPAGMERKNCKHVDRIQSEYEKRRDLLLPLFNAASMNEVYETAAETWDRRNLMNLKLAA